MSTRDEHRGGECSRCDGEGIDLDADIEEGEAAPECPHCEGSGTYTWFWECEDEGDCDWCKARNVPVDGWGEDGEDWICLACAKAAHARECGCNAEGWV